MTQAWNEAYSVHVPAGNIVIRLIKPIREQWQDDKPTSAVFNSEWPLSMWARARLDSHYDLRRGAFEKCGFFGLAVATLLKIAAKGQVEAKVTWNSESVPPEFEDVREAHTSLATLSEIAPSRNQRYRFAKRLSMLAHENPGPPLLEGPIFD